MSQSSVFLLRISQRRLRQVDQLVEYLLHLLLPDKMRDISVKGDSVCKGRLIG